MTVTFERAAGDHNQSTPGTNSGGQQKGGRRAGHASEWNGERKRMDLQAASLVVSSLSRLFPLAPYIDAVFNMRLHETHPDLYRLFELYVPPHERSVMRALRKVLGALGDFGASIPTVRALARNSNVFTIVDANYQALGETLIWTLRAGLGNGFTDELERAWNAALDLGSGGS